MLRGTNHSSLSVPTHSARGVGQVPGSSRSTYLATMPEANDGHEEEEEEDDGWQTNMLKRKVPGPGDSSEDPGLKEVGMFNMLQDVIRR
jgi:hypothetical protein